jgi:hypothetical protein
MSMKRLLLALFLICFASTPLAAATLGLYFDLWPGTMAYSPVPASFFDVYLYLHAANYYVTALEYQITTPLDPGHTLFVIAETVPAPTVVVQLGGPLDGHSVAFWPPLDGYTPGYNMICKYTCVTLASCVGPVGAASEGVFAMADYPIVVGPHPGSGELWGTYYPNNDTFPIVGLTSILCPNQVAVESTNWGAIKSLYR